MTLPEPAHPTVNWEIKERGADGWRVQVTCPVCLQARFEPTRTVRYRVRAGRFTGLCRDDWRSRPVTNSGRPPGNPPHPAVNWDSQRPGPNGMQVQVTCPVCMEDRCEAAKAVRYRILQGRFTGRCRLHAHLASQQPRPEAVEMQHPAVDWHARERRDGEYWVKVTCPACQQTRFEIAKSVRYRIRQGKYTGLCRADAQRARVAERRQAEGLSAEYSTMVEVMCPICQETRLVSAASVRRQKKLGTFTGRCGKDRLVGATRGEFRARPANPFVDWMDREVVVEAGYPPRRRSMIRIHCPHCGAVRLVHPAALERSLVTGTFRPECPLHRRDPLRQRPGESFPDESSRAG